ncbi:MAG: iron ABC transporter permease, partial [Nitriliruptoraceae bacterium]|nr:iron ABC transporter permease [Nitriliruptoraceae bacterium]
ALVVLGLLVAAPLVMVLWRAVTPDGVVDPAAPLAVLTEGTNLRIISNTVVLGMLVCVISTLFAAPLAFLMSRTELRRHRWIDVAVIVPFMTPPYINSIAWIIFMRRRGYLEQLIGESAAGVLQGLFFTPVGMAMVMSMNLFPFLYLLLRNSLDNLGASPDEAAAIHGGSPGYRLRRIVVPLMLSGYSMGMLLVFIKSAGEFGTPITLGNRIGFTVLVSEIYQNTSIFPIDFQAAASLSVVLLSMGIGAWGLQQWFVARRDDRVVAGRVARPAAVPLGRWRWAAWSVIGVVFGLSIVIPYLTVFASAFTRLESAGVVPSNLTLLHFQLLFDPRSGALDALFNSLRFALAAATIAAAIGLVVALRSVRREGRGGRGVDFLALAPDMVPAIVVVIGLIFFWNAAWQPAGIYNTAWMLILTYVVLYVPFSVQNVKAVYGQLGETLFEAAAVAGGSWWFRTRRILLPLIAPGLIAGWVMAFAISMRELVGSLLVRPPSVQVLSTFIFREFEQGNRSLGMALTIVGVFTTTVVLVLTDRWRDKLMARRVG